MEHYATAQQIWAGALVFSRVGAMLMVLPGIGETSVPPRIRLAFALMLSLCLGPIAQPYLPAEPSTVDGTAFYIVREVLIGLTIGAALIFAFIILAYGLFGVFAAVALIVNLLMMFGALSMTQATLTLPGIAGIVLTIATALDANVLVFERIREEQRLGRSPISAIDAGYGRALSAIVDANMTTLIAAILLFIFGSGPVKGFAVTLTIGILTSIFSAIMITRVIVIWWLRGTKPDRIPI